MSIPNRRLWTQVYSGMLHSFSVVRSTKNLQLWVHEHDHSLQCTMQKMYIVLFYSFLTSKHHQRTTNWQLYSSFYAFKHQPLLRTWAFLTVQVYSDILLYSNSTLWRKVYSDVLLYLFFYSRYLPCCTHYHSTIWKQVYSDKLYSLFYST
jgi:hypothetical protein